MLPRPYVGSYSGEKGHQFLHKPWILALSKSVETFIMVSIIDTQTIKYWQNLAIIMDKSKENIPKYFRIGDTCFTSFANIGGDLYARHPLTHVHRDSNDILSVIIILGTDVHSGETVFYDGDNINDIGKGSHVLKHSHGRCVIGAFNKILHRVSICTGRRAIISFILHKSIFLHFVHNGTRFDDKYILSEKIYILMMTGVVFFQNKILEIYTIQNIKRLIQIDIMF